MRLVIRKSPLNNVTSKFFYTYDYYNVQYLLIRI